MNDNYILKSSGTYRENLSIYFWDKLNYLKPYYLPHELLHGSFDYLRRLKNTQRFLNRKTKTPKGYNIISPLKGTKIQVSHLSGQPLTLGNGRIRSPLTSFSNNVDGVKEGIMDLFSQTSTINSGRNLETVGNY